MMNVKKFVVGIVAVAVIAAGGISLATNTTAAAPAPPAAQSAAGRYTVSQGVIFNTPDTRRSNAILKHVRRTINHVPKGEKIWIMSWNFQHRAITDALIRAHKRGVRVRLIMARQLARKQGYGGSFKRLKRVTKRKANRQRRKGMRSWARTCSNSCRGRGGSMHSKFMLVSKAGGSRKIVQHGSSNLTGSAGSKQWNDWYTQTGKRGLFRGWKKVFRQSAKDRPFGQYAFRHRKTWSWFAPRRADPVMMLLRKVTCKGARGAGVNGRTAIRIGSSVFQNERGIRIAKKLRRLSNQGCNIKVVFTMMTNKIRRIMRGDVRTRQLVQDFNGDGSFDRYLHMKSMTISGRFRKNRGARVVFNGSANWSRMGMRSDEQGMVIKGKGWLEKKYARRINRLFGSTKTIPLRSMRTPEEYRARGMENPYAELELELAGQG
jgi:phosphatidylserine/phosphatidylglycerophosphate/cardiolipin synthase-like enzyme